MQCVNCNKLLQGRKLKLSSIIPKQNFTVLEALTEIYGKRNIKDSETHRTCSTCATKLGSTCKYLREFRRLQTENSITWGLEKELEQGTTCSHITDDDWEHYDGDDDPSTPKRMKGATRKAVKATPVRKKMIKYARNKKSRTVMYSSIQNILQNEMENFQKNTSLRGEVKVKEDLLIPDETLENELKTHAPLIHQILLRLMKKKKLDPRVRTALGVIANTNNRLVSVFQKGIGLCLFYGRTTIRTYGILNKLGICCSYKTVVRTLDELIKTYDEKVLHFKQIKSKQILDATILSRGEEQMQVDDEHEMQPDVSRYRRKDGRWKKLNFGKENIDEENRVGEKELYFGGIFTVDNLNHVPQSLNKSTTTKTKAVNVTSTAFVENRVPQLMDEVIGPQKYKTCAEIPLSAFIPTKEDMDLVNNDHKIFMRRILVKNLPCFLSIQNCPEVIWHIKGEHDEWSKKKSEIVNLGILDANQATTAGTVDITKYLKGYFPEVEGKTVPTVVGGDCLTCVMLTATHDHRCTSDTKEEKLDGPMPAVGGFHLRMAVIDDILKLFHGDGEGFPGHGSLPNLRGMFGHPAKLLDSKKNFLLATRFLDFCLAAYICAFAVEILKLVDVNDPMESVSDRIKVLWMEEVVEALIKVEWMDVVKNTAQEKFCYCASPYSDSDKREMISCDNNCCPNEVWYHKDCLLSPINKKFRTPIMHADGSLNEKADYYCTQECELELKDKVYLYSKSFINAWLHFTGYRDSIRLNHGDRMNAYNKLHMIQFFNLNHPKYFQVCHLWQAHKAGWAAPNVAFDLLNNSTVNISGKPNTNLELDLFHEFLNRYLKSMSMLQYGNISMRAVIRRSKSYQILWDLRREWEKLLREVDQHDEEHHARYQKWRVDIPAAVKLLVKHKNLVKMCARAHPKFKNFKYGIYFVDDIDKYKKKYMAFAKRLDAAQKYRTETRLSTTRKTRK